MSFPICRVEDENEAVAVDGGEGDRLQRNRPEWLVLHEIGQHHSVVVDRVEGNVVVLEVELRTGSKIMQSVRMERPFEEGTILMMGGLPSAKLLERLTR